MQTSRDGDDLASSYWQTWCDWRDQYGVHDSCMEELHAAIVVELENALLPLEQRFRLRAIATLIQETREEVRQEMQLRGDRAA